MTGTYKQSYYKRLHQIERTQQQLYSHKLYRPAEDCHCHEHGPIKREPGFVHQQSVGNSHEPKSREYGNGVRECRTESRFLRFLHCIAL